MSYGNNFKRYGSGGDSATGGNQNNNGGNRGNWNNNRGSNGGNWGGKKDWGNKPIDPDPYIPVVFFSNTEPPLDIKNKFKELAERCKDLKFTIRVAGGNTEADDAARDAAGEKMEEYLPWKGFENRESAYQFSDDSSIEQACRFHPAADKMKDAAKKFLSRNYRMAQGKGLKSPAKIFILWSEDGASRLSEKTFKTGNAGHFLSIASALKTPVFNLGKPGTFEKLMEYLTPEKEPEYKPERPQGQGGYNNGNNAGYNNQNNNGYNRQQNNHNHDYQNNHREESRPSRDDDFDMDDY